MVFPDLLKEEESCAFGVDGGIVYPFPYFPSPLLLSPCSYVLHLLTSILSPGITLKD
jgi:hypothetical protein